MLKESKHLKIPTFKQKLQIMISNFLDSSFIHFYKQVFFCLYLNYRLMYEMLRIGRKITEM